METHSNWLKVSLIVGLLLTAAVGFAFLVIDGHLDRLVFPEKEKIGAILGIGG